MEYTITSEIFEGKKQGELITEKELFELGLNASALVASEHIKPAPTKSDKEIK